MSGAIARVAAAATDTLLEASVVPSFSRVGYLARHRLYAWTEPAVGSMAGRVVAVTGATGGLGGAVAAGLARLGATVWLLGRDRDRTERMAAQIRAELPRADLKVAVADLARLSDVHAVAETLLAGSERLDVVIHNAGALMSHRVLTVDGLETTAQVQLVAPFLLTSLLFHRLRSTPNARVITISSGGMYTQRLKVDALTHDHGSFNGVAAYAIAKRAQVVLTQEWARRTAQSGVTFHATHPGWVDTPGLRAALPRFARLMGPLLRTPQQGADTIVWLASSPTGSGGGGQFWHDRRPRSTVRLPWTATQKRDGGRLWEWTAARAGVSATPNDAPTAGARGVPNKQVPQ